MRSSGVPNDQHRHDICRQGYNEPMAGSHPVNPHASRVKLTYDDFVLFPDDGKRHEIVDGEHYVTPSPNVRHQQISLNLALAIGGWLQSHAIGRVFCAPLDIVFSDFDIVEPDLLICLTAAQPKPSLHNTCVVCRSSSLRST